MAECSLHRISTQKVHPRQLNRLIEVPLGDDSKRFKKVRMRVHAELPSVNHTNIAFLADMYRKAVQDVDSEFPDIPTNAAPAENNNTRRIGTLVPAHAPKSHLAHPAPYLLHARF